MSEKENPFLAVHKYDEIINLWQTIGKGCQVFYDKGASILILKKNADIYFLRPNEIRKSQKFQLKTKIDNIFAFVLKKNNKVIALQNSINSIIILNINNEKEMTITITKQSKQNALNSIVHFDFVYTSPIFDLVVVETSGIHFFKIDDDKMHSKEIKFIALTINYCWFEPKNEVLCVSSQKEKGLIQTFFMEKCKSNLTKVRGPSFQLDINADTSPKKTNLMQFMNKSFSYFSQDDKIIIDCDRKNKDLTGFMTQDHISHKVMATNLYNKTYLIHLNAFQGKAFIFYITNDKASLLTPILSIPSDGIYSLGAVDNLLLIHNHSECISMVYDIKRYHLIFPIGAPTSLPLMTPKAQESNLSESENKKCNSPNSIKEQPKKLNLNFSKTVCATSHEFMSSLKNDIDSYQQESIIINKCEKLDVSIDPNYMEKINRFTKSDYDTNLDSKSTLKSIFSKSILRTQDNNEDQIFKNISETEKKVEYKVLDKEEEIHLENIEDGFKIDQKFETSQNQNENLFEINENLQEDLKNENNSINENSKETIEKKEKLNENNVIDNEHNQKINKKEKYTENKELILNEEKFEKKVDKQNINESDEEQPRNEKKKKKTEKNFININKKIPKNSEEKINKEKIEYEADYSLNIYKDAFVFLEDEYIIDLNENRFFKMEMNLFQISKYMDDKIDAFFIILRRKNAKFIALDFLADLIKKKSLLIMNLSYIFRNIFEIYKKSLVPEQSLSKDVIHSKKKESITEIKESKLDNGYTIINQSDCYKYLFKKIIEEDEENLDSNYMIISLIQFTREAMECELQPLMNIQHLLIKLILESKKFNLFHSLLQFHAFNDSNELAHILIDFDSNSLIQKNYKNKLGNTLLRICDFENYSPCFQIGVDILSRQKKFYDLAEVFLKKGMAYQALDLIKKQKLRNIPLENIIAVSQFFECNMTKENICAFFEEAEYENQIQFGKKTKQNMFSFSLDQLKNGLKL